VLLTLAIGVHQVVMASPAIHAHSMPVYAPATTMGETRADCTGICSETMTAACPAIVALLTDITILPLLILVMALAIAASVRTISRHFSDWRWPPSRRRALLQVFLC